MLYRPEEYEEYSTSYLRRGLLHFDLAVALSSIPLVITFIIVSILSYQSLFPLLSGQSKLKHEQYENPPRRSSYNPLNLPSVIRHRLRFSFEKAAALTFSATVALSTVLAELIFCEITGTLNPETRGIALELTISILLLSLVLITPALEIHSITAAASWKLRGGEKRWHLLLSWIFDFVGLAGWLLGFWWIGRAVLGKHPLGSKPYESHGFSEGSLERIGIIGISLMGSLAGFAAVSSLWQTFGVRYRKVTEGDIARKQGGLEATNDMLETKQSRLRALERKFADMPATQASFMTRITSSIRGNAETQELQMVKLEVSGLETMQMSLANSVRLLKSRREAQQQASTAFGRLCITASYMFSLYCLYRITATSIATLRRWKNPTTTFANSDPINNVLALVAKHWDPSLDRAAWSRQISFLLSGLMLLASFNAVLQTVLLFARFTPTRLQHSAQQNLALLVSQISATYVVSSALLLRSNLPRDIGSVIEGALRAPLDTAFVERWFEAWFLASCAVTAVGIWFGRKVVGNDDWGDDAEEMDVEAGKMN